MAQHSYVQLDAHAIYGLVIVTPWRFEGFAIAVTGTVRHPREVHTLVEVAVEEEAVEVVGSFDQDAQVIAWCALAQCAM